MQLAKFRFLLNYARKKNGPLGNLLCRDATVKTSYGCFRCRKRTNDLDIVYEGFESEILNVFKPKAGENVIDCGAHIGKYTVLASKLVGKVGHVVAVEPSPENYETLLLNIALNSCYNVIPMNRAVWRENEEVKLWISQSKATHSLKQSWDQATGASTEREFVTVRGLKLDELLETMDRIDWLKLDVEGAELEALCGALEGIEKKKIHNIIVEASDEKSPEFLKTHGYLLTKISTLRPYYLARLN